MPYITILIKPKEYQLSIEDIINGVDENFFERQNDKNTYDTRTVFRERTPLRLLENVNFDSMIFALAKFNKKYEHLIAVEDKSTLYSSFKIPKRSGGLRPIDKPNDELMLALRELKMILEKKLYANYHTSAFAYVRGRSTIDAVKRHQKNGSKWFLKLDFHNFFGSSTQEFVISQLKQIFPFCELYKREDGARELNKALSLCFLRNGLPQGTPISPMLTNLFMIPVDHDIAKNARESNPHLVYTRYADDIILSSDLSFNWNKAQQMVLDILSQYKAPFSLNTDKTRYGSSAGRNWNLGVMLNKDNDITIGHAKKKMFKTMVFSFMNDDKNGVHWSVEDVQHLLGLASYYKMVEKDSIEEILKSYSAKFGKNVEETAKDILRSAV